MSEQQAEHEPGDLLEVVAQEPEGERLKRPSPRVRPPTRTT